MKLETPVHDVDTQAFFADTKRLEHLKSKNDPESLRQVAKEFEALFLQMALKSMRDANKAFKSELSAAGDMEHYEEMYDQQLALHLSQSGNMGLADAIVRQMQPENSILRPIDKNDLKMPSAINTDSIKQAKILNRISNELAKTDINLRVKTADKAEPKLTKQKFTSPKDFIDSLMPIVNKFVSKLGVDPKVVLAQAALETGWGQKIAKNHRGSSSYNLFGIKADKSWDGKSTLSKTVEFRNGVLQQEQARFRAYNSFDDSVKDYVRFLSTNKRYQNALETATPANYVQELQKAGYATDPNYADNIMRVYKSKLMQLHTET